MNDNNLSVVGRIRAFDQRNGGNPVDHNQWLYYANGAKREFEPYGALIDPPADEYQRFTNVLRYHEGRLAKAMHSFQNLREQLLMCPYPDKAALDELKRLQTLVGERNAAVAEAKEQLANTDVAKQRERNRQSNAEQKAQRDEFRSRVRMIRV